MDQYNIRIFVYIAHADSHPGLRKFILGSGMTPESEVFQGPMTTTDDRSATDER